MTASASGSGPWRHARDGLRSGVELEVKESFEVAFADVPPALHYGDRGVQKVMDADVLVVLQESAPLAFDPDEPVDGIVSGHVPLPAASHSTAGRYALLVAVDRKWKRSRPARDRAKRRAACSTSSALMKRLTGDNSAHEATDRAVTGVTELIPWHAACAAPSSPCSDSSRFMLSGWCELHVRPAPGAC